MTFFSSVLCVCLLFCLRVLGVVFWRCLSVSLLVSCLVKGTCVCVRACVRTCVCVCLLFECYVICILVSCLLKQLRNTALFFCLFLFVRSSIGGVAYVTRF